jgi:hypothetical protein
MVTTGSQKIKVWGPGGTPLGILRVKHLHTTQDLVPELLLNHCEGLNRTFPKIGTKFEAHSLFRCLTHREIRHKSHTQPQINACENCPRTPSYVQLGTLRRYGSLLVCASHYHNCCIDGGAIPELFCIPPRTGHEPDHINSGLCIWLYSDIIRTLWNFGQSDHMTSITCSSHINTIR